MAEKSALYPSATWEDSVEFARAVASFNLKAVSYTEVGKKYGLKSPTARSFTNRLSSAKQYGLVITSGGNTIQITETGKRLLYPTGEDTTVLARTCFGMPPLYSKLIAKYDGKALPSTEILSNILMNDHNITKSAKDVAAKVFMESANQLGLIQGGVLCYSELSSANVVEKAEETPGEDPCPGATTVVQGIADQINNIMPYASQNISNESEYITQTIPFESGKIARVVIPVDATEDDLLLLHDILNIIIKRKFKFDIK